MEQTQKASCQFTNAAIVELFVKEILKKNGLNHIAALREI